MQRTLEEIELNAIREAIARHAARGLAVTESKQAAADELGIGIATLYRRLAKADYQSDKPSATCPSRY